MRQVWLFLAAFLISVAFSCGTTAPARSEEDPPAGSGLVESDWIQLDESASWQENRGEWIEVGLVSLDSEDEIKLAFEAGKKAWVNGPAGKTVDLHSTVNHGDVEAHIEFMVPKRSNSGVYFQSRYEVQIFDSWQVEPPRYSDCGGIYQRWKDNQGYEGHAPRLNASRRPGEWQSFDVVFRAPRFDSAGSKTENARFVKVVHNGVVIHENVELTGPTRAASFPDETPMGPLMIQGDHGPVAFKNVRIKPIHLD